MNPLDYCRVDRKLSHDGPFSWQAIEAIQRIQNGFDNSRKLPYALAVYLVLTQLARENACSSFRENRRRICALAGCSLPQFDAIKNSLIELGLLAVEQNEDLEIGGLLPNTYTLLRIYDEHGVHVPRRKKGGGW